MAWSRELHWSCCDFIREEAYPEQAESKASYEREEAYRAPRAFIYLGIFEWVEPDQGKPGDGKYCRPAQFGRLRI